MHPFNTLDEMITFYNSIYTVKNKANKIKTLIKSRFKALLFTIVFSIVSLIRNSNRPPNMGFGLEEIFRNLEYDINTLKICNIIFDKMIGDK